MHVLEVDPQDADAFADWFGVVSAAHRHRHPGEPGWTLRELAAVAVAARAPGAAIASVHLLVRDDGGRAVGAVRLDLPQRDNLSTAELFELSVLPEARRRGVGRAVLTAAADRARGAGRTDLVGQTVRRQGVDDDPGAAFARVVGARPAQTVLRRDLALPPDLDRLAALEESARRHAAGYALRCWEGSVPDGLLEDRAHLARRMSTDAPAGDLPRGEEEWDAARVRGQEDLLRGQGRLRLSVGAVHEATGRLVAYTDLCLPEDAPERAYQWDTLVLREHRGHRLGLLLKAVNLRRAAQAWPRTRTVSTWNAQDNAPMIAVNEALGCTVASTSTEWRLAL